MIHNGVEYRRSTQGDCEYCDLKETCDEEDSGTILKACITVDELTETTGCWKLKKQ